MSSNAIKKHRKECEHRHATKSGRTEQQKNTYMKCQASTRPATSRTGPSRRTTYPPCCRHTTPGESARERSKERKKEKSEKRKGGEGQRRSDPKKCSKCPAEIGAIDLVLDGLLMSKFQFPWCSSRLRKFDSSNFVQTWRDASTRVCCSGAGPRFHLSLLGGRIELPRPVNHLTLYCAHPFGPIVPLRSIKFLL